MTDEVIICITRTYLQTFQSLSVNTRHVCICGFIQSPHPPTPMFKLSTVAASIAPYQPQINIYTSPTKEFAPLRQDTNGGANDRRALKSPSRYPTKALVAVLLYDGYVVAVLQYEQARRRSCTPQTHAILPPPPSPARLSVPPNTLWPTPDMPRGPPSIARVT